MVDEGVHVVDDARLQREAWGLIIQTRIAASAQTSLARRWSRVNLVLGLPSAVLAAAAGAAAFAQLAGNVLAGVLAIAAAVLSATLVFLNPAPRATKAESAANRYRAIHDEATAIAHNADGRDSDQVRGWLKELRIEKGRVNQSADLPPMGIWKRAEKESLASDGTYYSWTDSLAPDDITAAAARPNKGAASA